MILYSLLGLGGSGLLIWAVFSIRKWGAAEAEKKQAEKDRDNAQENAERLANRPRNLTDRVIRLREWRDKLKD